MNFLIKNTFLICFRSHGNYGNNRMSSQDFQFKLSTKHSLKFVIHLEGRHLKQMLHEEGQYPTQDNFQLLLK